MNLERFIFVVLTYFIQKNLCSLSDLKCLEYSKVQTSSLKPYPHMVWLRIQTNRKINTDCVGTLISEQFVLTHITCVEDKSIVLQKSRVFFSFDEFYGIREIFQHPFWSGDSIYYSIALIKLDRQVPLDAFHRPACIWTNDFYNGTRGMHVNWLGKSEWSDNFEFPVVEVFDDHRCHQYHPNINISHVCNSPVETKYAAFQPTKGSALQLQHNNNAHVIGLHSYYFANTNPVILVSSRTSLYKEWIEDIVWPIDNSLPKLCGEIKVKSRTLIAHGEPTFPGEFPWHVAINLRESFTVKKYICGGSIVTNKAIITAAHCVVTAEGDVVPERLTIETAKHRLDLSTQESREIQVFDVIRHEKYNTDFFENDIAILKLGALIEFATLVQPICLTGVESIFGSNAVGIVPGWGRTENNRQSNDMLKATLLIRSNDECRDIDRDFFPLYVNENNFCGGYRNGTNVCDGDSGGGLTLQVDGRSYLRGLVSLGKLSTDNEHRCDIKELVILTDVVKFYDWIISKL